MVFYCTLIRDGVIVFSVCRTIADKLKIGLDVEPESFDRVTLYFSDISGFQDLAAECSPFQVENLTTWH